METRSNTQIAIIDDDPLVREALRDCMESAGYTVEDFGTAEGFSASDSAQSAACLIVDIQLPGMSGLELQRQLAGAGFGVPIVFVSAHGTDANREQAMMLGAAAFLTKPVRREELLHVVRAAIKH